MANPVRWSRWRLLFAALLAVPAALALWVWLAPWFRTVRREGQLYAVQCGGKWGHIDERGLEAAPFVWDDAEDFDRDPLAVVKRGERFGYVDRHGKPAGDCVWNVARKFGGAEFAEVRRDDKCGLVDRTGKLVVPCEWESIVPFDQEGMACVLRGGKYGFIDRSGTLVIPCEWDRPVKFAHGLAAVSKPGGGGGYIDRTGKLVCTGDWTPRLADEFGADGWASAGKQVADDFEPRPRRFGFIDRTGRWAMPCEWDYAWRFGRHLVAVRREGILRLLDRTGRVAVAGEWQELQELKHGLARAKRGGKWGYLDAAGQLALPYQWQEAEDFGPHGMAAVMSAGKWGIIDRTGKQIVPCDYDELQYRSHLDFFHASGLAFVQRGRESGFIDGAGRWAFANQWEFVAEFNPEGTALVWNNPPKKRGREFGLIGRDGRLIVPLVWSSQDQTRDGYLAPDAAPQPDFRLHARLHELLDATPLGPLLRKTGLDKHPRLNVKVTGIFDARGQLIWRSDFHAARVLLPWLAALFGLPALWLLWTARRREPSRR